MNIIVYTKTGCPWCIAVTDYLNENTIPFEEKKVTENPELFTEMEELSGQTKAPVLVIDGTVYPDSDVDELKEILKRTD